MLVSSSATRSSGGRSTPPRSESSPLALAAWASALSPSFRMVARPSAPALAAASHGAPSFRCAPLQSPASHGIGRLLSTALGRLPNHRVAGGPCFRVEAAAPGFSPAAHLGSSAPAPGIPDGSGPPGGADDGLRRGGRTVACVSMAAKPAPCLVTRAAG